MEISNTILKLYVHILRCIFLPNFVVEPLKRSIQTVNLHHPRGLMIPYSSVLSFLCAMQNNVCMWGSGWCYNTEGLPLTQISYGTSRPHCQLGEASTCQELSSSADEQWRLSSTILRTKSQKPLVYWIVSVSSFSFCVHRVLTIFAIICLRGHGKWCLCPPLPFCIKLIFGTA